MIYGLTCRTQRDLQGCFTKRASARQRVKCVQKISSFVNPLNPIDAISLQIWENAPITLDTTNPTFGLDTPFLPAWNLSLENPACTGTGIGLGKGGAQRHRRIIPDKNDLDYVEHQVTQITSSTGSINATFRIPGRTTIPSDEEEHSVTIADLRLHAKVTWVCIPKADTRVHLEVRPNLKYSLSIFSVLSLHRPTLRILRLTPSSLAAATYTSTGASFHGQRSQMSAHKRCSTVLLGGFSL